MRLHSQKRSAPHKVAYRTPEHDAALRLLASARVVALGVGKPKRSIGGGRALVDFRPGSAYGCRRSNVGIGTKLTSVGLLRDVCFSGHSRMPAKSARTYAFDPQRTF